MSSSPWLRALHRARIAIVSVFAAYVFSCAFGAAQVHCGSAFALHYRDRIVGAAQSSGPLTQLNAGHRFSAGMIDFAGNLVGGTSSGLLGLFPPTGYAMAAFRGWIGGIVSVDAEHRSRLGSARSAIYYVGVVFFQLVPYSLVGGAGINLGLTLYRKPPHYEGPRWLGLPVEAMRDALRIYLLAIPLFFVASLIEFFFG